MQNIVLADCARWEKTEKSEVSQIQLLSRNMHIRVYLWVIHTCAWLTQLLCAILICRAKCQKHESVASTVAFPPIGAAAAVDRILDCKWEEGLRQTGNENGMAILGIPRTAAAAAAGETLPVFPPPAPTSMTQILSSYLGSQIPRDPRIPGEIGPRTARERM